MADLANNKIDDDIDEEQVALYLRNHPGFFLRRDDLLMELQLAHATGGAVSLLERQVSLLRERNMDMRSRLHTLMENARTNDKLFERSRKLVLALLEAQTLDGMVAAFQHSLAHEFKCEFSALVLFGKPEQYRHVAARMVSLDDAYRQIPGLLKNSSATCGMLRPEELRFLFGDKASEVGSAAVVPLNFGYPLGITAIGSRDPHHFRPNMGTMFLGHLAEVLDRLLPRHLKQSG